LPKIRSFAAESTIHFTGMMRKGKEPPNICSAKSKKIMKIYGYGEDALTLWSLTTGLSEFLRQCDDSTPTDDKTVYFRPSFGRRAPNPHGKPSVFGEFDAIVTTHKAHYLVEAKWNTSSELDEDILTVESRQCRRHGVLRWYVENWKKSQPISWSEFRSSFRELFEATFGTLTIPTPGTKLAKNLEFILSALVEQDLPLFDVLLFITVKPSVQPKAVRPERFRLVVMTAENAGGDGFIDLNK